MKALLAICLLMLLATKAEAQRRPAQPIYTGGMAVEAALSAALCQFARYSVPPGKQAGKCPPRPQPRR